MYNKPMGGLDAPTYNNLEPISILSIVCKVEDEYFVFIKGLFEQELYFIKDSNDFFVTHSTRRV